MTQKIRVGVIFGGRSVEHEISVISGLQACYAFDTEKYDVIPVYISKSGDMYAGGDVGEIEAYADIEKLISGAVKVNLVKQDNRFVLSR